LLIERRLEIKEIVTLGIVRAVQRDAAERKKPRFCSRDMIQNISIAQREGEPSREFLGVEEGGVGRNQPWVCDNDGLAW
jgi:hypothetical protein